MINEPQDSTTVGYPLRPLVSFPELDPSFPQLPAAAADACLSRCLSRLQDVPADEQSLLWAQRLALTLCHLLSAAQAHSPQAADSLTERLAHWTVDRFLHCDTIAVEILIALKRHGPCTLVLAGGTIVKRLVSRLQKREPLPAWTAALIGLLRQLSSAPGLADSVQDILSALPDWRAALSPDAFEQSLAADDRTELLMLVGNLSLLGLMKVEDEPGQPLTHCLPPGCGATIVAPRFQDAVRDELRTQTIRLPWVLTPRGTESICKLLAKATALFAPPALEAIRLQVVLSLGRHAAIQHHRLQGAEATLLVLQVQQLVAASPALAVPHTWGQIWASVRQLAVFAHPRPTLTLADTDCSRAVNALLSPQGLVGDGWGVGWRVTLLKQAGLDLPHWLGALVQQSPPMESGKLSVSRMLQVAQASAHEHQLALTEIASKLGQPAYLVAVSYTRYMLHLEMVHELMAAQQHGNRHPRRGAEEVMQQAASQFEPGALTLGLFSHVYEEMRWISFSSATAAWVVACLKASVEALRPHVPVDFVKQVCDPIVDDLLLSTEPELGQQLRDWLATL